MRAAVLLLLAAAAPAAAAAQAHSSLALGLGRWDSGLASADAMTLGAELGLRGASGGLRAAGTVFRWTDDGTVVFDGTLSGAFSRPLVRGLRGGIGVAAERMERRGFEPRTRLSLRVGPELRLPQGEVSARAGVDRVLVNDGWRDVAAAELSLGRRARRWDAGVSARGFAFGDREVVTRDTVYYVGGYPFHSTRSEVEHFTRRYLDLEAGGSWGMGPVAFSASLGARTFGVRTRAERWGRVVAAVTLSPRLALVGEAGRSASAPDVLLPGRDYATVTLRVLPRPPRPLPLVAPRPADGPRVVVTPAGEGALVRIEGLAAARVEVMGDFSDWTAVELRGTGEGGWEVPARLPAGYHRLVIRVDGGDWRPPPDLPVAADEFQGEVGILVVD